MSSETLNCGCGSPKNKKGKCLKVLVTIVGGIKSLASVIGGITFISYVSDRIKALASVISGIIIAACTSDSIVSKVAVQPGITVYCEATCAPYTDGLPILRSVERIILRDCNGNILRAQPQRQ